MYITLYLHIYNQPLSFSPLRGGDTLNGAQRPGSHAVHSRVSGSVGGRGVGGSDDGSGGGNVAMTVCERMDDVGQKVTVVINARQTDLAQDVHSDSVVSRMKHTRPAHRPGPVTEDAQVLLVVTCFSMYAIGTPLAL